MKRLLILMTTVSLAAGVIAEPRKGTRPKAPASRGVSLDVKDADVRDILREVKVQCGIRNLIVDRDVRGTGTFLFRDVPCPQAIRTITASLGLDYEIESSYVRVATGK